MEAKTKGIIFLGAAALAAFLGYKVYAVKQQIQFEFVNASFKLKNVFNSVLTVQFRIINPSLLTVNFESLSGNVFVGGVNVGQLHYLDSLTIPAKGIKTISIPMDLSNIGSANQILSVISTGKAPEVKVMGLINLKGNSIPFNAVIAGGIAK